MSKGVFQPRHEQVISMAREAIALSMAGRPGRWCWSCRAIWRGAGSGCRRKRRRPGRRALAPPALAAMVERLSAAEKP